MNYPADPVQRAFNVSGLSGEEAAGRLKEKKSSIKKPLKWHHAARMLMAQYRNPLVLLLIFAAILSLILKEYSDSIIILTVLLLTGILGFIQEYHANRAVEKLKAIVENKVIALRSGVPVKIPLEEIVENDIVLLSAGDIIPGDAVILASNDLHVNESVLTGESFPAEKFAASSAAGAKQPEAINMVLKGTHVINGTATIKVLHTGQDTEFGKLAASLYGASETTAFEKGIYHFGYLLMRVVVIMSMILLVTNVLFHKPLVESMLFALALAVGITPELLPAIVTINLSAGARSMASKKVIVKKLSAIQNLGEMNILCSDKTGTLTEGSVKLKGAFGTGGLHNEKVLLMASLNARFETGFSNVIDETLRAANGFSPDQYTKFDEVPYDFIRKRLSVVVSDKEKHIMITKGAFSNVLQVCTKAEQEDGALVDIEQMKAALETQFEMYCTQGFRTIAVAWKDVSGDPVINRDDETDMIFLGFIVLFDPPKQGVPASLLRLSNTGIRLKLISGDNRFVVQHLASETGISKGQTLTGDELHRMEDDALMQKVNETDLFAEIEPSQKERIVKALQKNGFVVGYMGDGINDVSALKTADVGISTDNAVDIAREAADLVLLEKDINVIVDGIIEGRKTFINTLKYIFVSTSANFGNMFSMAAASLLLPFLPLLPVQILLNNFLCDLPALAITSDSVDAELVKKPKSWDTNYIKRFMLVFGLQSSFFDFTTFGLLLYVFHVDPAHFRTAWFMESLLTQLLIFFIIRTAQPFYKSRPSRYLLFSGLAALAFALMLPYLSFAHIFELTPLPFYLFATVIIITIAYIITAGLTKKLLMKRL
jgi:Mg2+-importing ATPase